jgi:hypothetical protein
VTDQGKGRESGVSNTVCASVNTQIPLKVCEYKSVGIRERERES